MAAKKFYSPIDLQQLALNNAQIQNLAADPGPGVLGQVYYNTGSSVLKVCTVASVSAATWSAVESSGATSSTLGLIEINTDLGGTATAPNVVGATKAFGVGASAIGFNVVPTFTTQTSEAVTAAYHGGSLTLASTTGVALINTTIGPFVGTATAATLASFTALNISAQTAITGMTGPVTAYGIYAAAPSIGTGANWAIYAFGNLGVAGTLSVGSGPTVVTDSVGHLLSSTLTGQIPATTFPILTGDVTTAGGALATTAAATQHNITTIAPTASALTLTPAPAAANTPIGLTVNGTVTGNGTNPAPIGIQHAPTVAVTTATTGTLTGTDVNATFNLGTSLAIANVTQMHLDPVTTTGTTTSTVTTFRELFVDAQAALANTTTTTLIGIDIGAMTGGATNNYGLRIASPSGGATNNYALQTTGSAASVFGGSLVVGTNTIATTAGVDAGQVVSISSSRLAAATMPAFTGDITSVAGAVATTAAATQSNITAITPISTLTLGGAFTNNANQIGISVLPTLTTKASTALAVGLSVGATLTATTTPPTTSLTGLQLAAYTSPTATSGTTPAYYGINIASQPVVTNLTVTAAYGLMVNAPVIGTANYALAISTAASPNTATLTITGAGTLSTPGNLATTGSGTITSAGSLTVGSNIIATTAGVDAGQVVSISSSHLAAATMPQFTGGEVTSAAAGSVNLTVGATVATLTRISQASVGIGGAAAAGVGLSVLSALTPAGAATAIGLDVNPTVTPSGNNTVIYGTQLSAIATLASTTGHTLTNTQIAVVTGTGTGSATYTTFKALEIVAQGAIGSAVGPATAYGLYAAAPTVGTGANWAIYASGNLGLTGTISAGSGPTVITDSVGHVLSSVLTGQIPAATFPILTGDVTTAGGALATTAAATQNNITAITPVSTLTLGGAFTNNANQIGVSVLPTLTTKASTALAVGLNVGATLTAATTPPSTSLTGLQIAAYSSPTATSGTTPTYYGLNIATQPAVTNLTVTTAYGAMVNAPAIGTTNYAFATALAATPNVATLTITGAGTLSTSGNLVTTGTGTITSAGNLAVNGGAITTSQAQLILPGVTGIANSSVGTAFSVAGTMPSQSNPLAVQIYTTLTPTTNSTTYGLWEGAILSLPTSGAAVINAHTGINVGQTTNGGGATSGSNTIAVLYGLNIAAQGTIANATVTNAYGLYVNGPTGGGTLNVAAYVGGITQLNGNVTHGATSVQAFGLYQLGGQTKFDALATPGIVTIGVITNGAAASYWYWLVAEDRNGFQTLMGASATTAVGPATFDGTHTIALSWTAVAGAVKYYVLRTTSSTAPTGTASVLAGSPTTNAFTDNVPVGSLTSFTVPVRNATADVMIQGNIGVGTAPTGGIGIFSSTSLTGLTTSGIGVAAGNAMSPGTNGVSLVGFQSSPSVTLGTTTGHSLTGANINGFTGTAAGGSSVTSSYGVYIGTQSAIGSATGPATAYGIYVNAPTIGTANFAGYFSGDVRVTGNLTVTGEFNETAGTIITTGDAFARFNDAITVHGGNADAGIIVKRIKQDDSTTRSVQFNWSESNKFWAADTTDSTGDTITTQRRVATWNTYTITGDNATTAFAITHNLNNQWPHVMIYENATNAVVEVDVVATSATVSTVNFAVAPAGAVTFKAIVVG